MSYYSSKLISYFANINNDIFPSVLIHALRLLIWIGYLLVPSFLWIQIFTQYLISRKFLFHRGFFTVNCHLPSWWPQIDSRCHLSWSQASRRRPQNSDSHPLWSMTQTSAPTRCPSLLHDLHPGRRKQNIDGAENRTISSAGTTRICSRASKWFSHS